jgi:hypothetical protein
LQREKPKDNVNMHDRDEWGKDSSVQIMRTVFKSMEKAQQTFLSRLGISLYDLRIRKWREKSLALFDQAWRVANRIGISMDATMASEMYLHCLAKIIASEGHEIPEGIVPEGKEVERLFEEMPQ